ncbi:MAG: response regulator [Alphaproteobacteria bacterium]|nr:response regulator [Alphaproteobacteria bacterium]
MNKTNTHIMVVDDDKTMLHYLTKALEENGYQISGFNDSLRALETLKTAPPDNLKLLLTDIIMPGIDGMELADKAQKLYPDLQVMFISGFASHTPQKGETSTAPVMMKPLHMKALIEQIDTILSSQIGEPAKNT